MALIRSCYDIHSIALTIQYPVVERAISKQLDLKTILMLLHCSEVSISLMSVNTEYNCLPPWVLFVTVLDAVQPVLHLQSNWADFFVIWQATVDKLALV